MKRKTLIPMTFAALILLLLSPAASQAADVAFENADGTFQWISYYGFGDDHTLLDITQPKTQDGSTGLTLRYEAASATPHFDYTWIPAAARQTAPLTIYDEIGDGYNIYFAQTFAVGEEVGPGLAFDHPSLSHGYPPVGVELRNSYTSPPIDIDLGDTALLGVRIEQAGQTHYGWIQMERVGVNYQPTAWGYQTTPDAPAHAGVPEPHGVLLLLGATGLMSMRRRRPASAGS
jgi:hypothetical protein